MRGLRYGLACEDLRFRDSHERQERYEIGQKSLLLYTFQAPLHKRPKLQVVGQQVDPKAGCVMYYAKAI